MHIRILINQYASSYYRNFFSRFVLKKIYDPKKSRDFIYRYLQRLKFKKPSNILKAQINDKLRMTNLIKKTKYNINKFFLKILEKKLFENNSILIPSTIKSLNKILNKQKLLLNELNYIGKCFREVISPDSLIQPSILNLIPCILDFLR